MNLKTDIVVIGAGQAGLSTGYHLRRHGVVPVRGYVMIDAAERPGGAWQHRWPSLTLSTVNRIHDLPGMRFEEVVGGDSNGEVQARVGGPRYSAEYERKFELPVYRPLRVRVVCCRGERFMVESDRLTVSARGIVNATGTWETPNIPEIPGAERFLGETLHTRDYEVAEAFIGRHVVIVGAGISAIQLLDEISRVTRTTWVTRRVPEFRSG